MKRSAILATIAVFALSGCQKAKDQSQTADSTARNLTLAPTESTAQMHDVPANPPAPARQPQRAAPPPATRPPVTRRPTPPMARLAAGTTLDIAATDTISSRSAKPGDAFTARVVEDIRNGAGRVVIPAGSLVNGKISDVQPAPNPSTPGTLTLSVSSITVRGTSYPIEASVDSLETIHKSRGAVTTGDAEKVGAGAVAGAILGRVLGGNKKGTIIGGIVGGAAGAVVANRTKDSDIVLPAGAHIIIRLTKELAVAAS